MLIQYPNVRRRQLHRSPGNPNLTRHLPASTIVSGLDVCLRLTYLYFRAKDAALTVVIHG